LSIKYAKAIFVLLFDENISECDYQGEAEGNELIPLPLSLRLTLQYLANA
jgi:hypothetical protein